MRILYIFFIVCLSSAAFSATPEKWYECLKSFDHDGNDYISEHMILYKGKAYEVIATRFQTAIGVTKPFCVQFDRNDNESVVWMDCAKDIRRTDDGQGYLCKKDTKKDPCPADQSGDFRVINDELVTQTYHPYIEAFRQLQWYADFNKEHGVDKTPLWIKTRGKELSEVINKIEKECVGVKLDRYNDKKMSRTYMVRRFRKEYLEKIYGIPYEEAAKTGEGTGADGVTGQSPEAAPK